MSRVLLMRRRAVAPRKPALRAQNGAKGERMEILFVIVAVVVFFWWRARHAGTVRYQAHKDALEAGRELLRRYWSAPNQTLSIPLEYRNHAASRLENIKTHVDTTMVPAQLGNAGLFRELLEDVTWVQMASTGNVRAQGQRAMRAMTFSELFVSLKSVLDSHKEDAWFKTDLATLEQLLSLCREAIAWFEPGETHEHLKVSPAKARRRLQKGQELVERLRADNPNAGS